MIRRIFVSALTSIVAFGIALPAVGQAFPAKPIRIVVSFPPGGATDTFSRVLAEQMTKALKQRVFVENRPGAGTTIACDFVAKAPPDGYTLLFTDLSTHTITASIYKHLPYSPLRDFSPVAVINTTPLILVAHPSVGVKSVRELIALAKRHPGITFGNSGIGTVTHMTAEKFRLKAGIQVTPVSYKGGAVPIVALLSGEIAMVMSTVPATIQHIRLGKLVALGLAAEHRFPSLPDIPAIAETVKGVDGAVISGALAPAGTPPAVIERLNAEFAKASETEKAKEIFAANAAEAVHMSPSELQRRLQRDAKSWAEVVKATGVSLD